MIISIHQPNFLPWIGYFYKIAKSDVFVILDSVQYPRGKSVANRSQIKTSQGILEIAVPISKKSNIEGLVSYNEVNFGETNWQKKILRSIQQAYAKSPFFNNYFKKLEEILFIDSFSQMNIEFIKFIVQELSINSQIAVLSKIENLSIDKNQRIIDLCKIFHSNCYLSGEGGKNYNDESLFKQNSIDLIYTDYKFIEYPQLHGAFIPKLSIIDLIFNCGPDSKKYF